MTDKTQKTALVTGAARGIGLATAHLFLDRGWRVAMVDIDGAELGRAASGLTDVLAITADVSDPEQVAGIRQKVSELDSSLAALVNNAGVADFGPIAETTFDRWRRVMATNLDGPFLMTQAFTEALAKARGAVVNITSISGVRASTLRVAYGTSKAALAHLTLQQAVELGELGVRVNAVAPGPVDTKLAMAVHTADIRAAYHDAIPLNRYGQEAEIANAIVFLCSAEASYVTGQILAADGGFSAAGVGLPSLRLSD
ncbi:SDR family NAD(P)-dependent oxidoreductase [Pelagibius sp. Alg239-R121]|uniref:SDR family NAD(P)-dependent oxidoreductase n=1 Tax=Pelagibius sp. Alg239-R121 TaxID=2993448 RepID=UPI0024A74D56|nr:SDR family oxidoreductase [Pelagibius sp. Alg239-R121]